MEGTQPEISLQAIFRSSYSAFERVAKLSQDMRNAAWSILSCRTAARGGHVERCPNGHVKKAWYNSCLHRSCPQCGYSKLLDWLEAKSRMLLPCGHFHLTFGFPSEFLGLWRANRARMGNLMFEVVSKSLREALDHQRFIVGKPGFLLTLHTWNRRILCHPHIHCLLSAGGFLNGGWLPCRRRKWLMPTEAIRLAYRKHMTRSLLRLLRQGELVLPAGETQPSMIAIVERVGKTRWIVDRRKRYAHGQGIVAYLGRYLRGGPISPKRLVGHDETVRFITSRKGEETSIETVSPHEFLSRLLDHVPPKGFRSVRGYGLYAHTAKEEREACREILESQLAPSERHEPIVFERQVAREKCPVCQETMIVCETLPRERAGPWLFEGKIAP